MNHSSWKVKFQTVQFLSVKETFWKFEGKFDFENQGQCQFSKSLKHLDDQLTNLKDKFQKIYISEKSKILDVSMAI